MRKNNILLSVLIITIKFSIANGQQRNLDSVAALLQTDNEDTNKVIHLNSAARYSQFIDESKSLDYANRAAILAQKENYSDGLIFAYSTLGSIYTNRGNFPKALDCYLKALTFASQSGKKNSIAGIKKNLGVMYWEEQDYLKALSYDLEALKMYEEVGNKTGLAMTNGNIAGVYYQMGNKNKALDYYNRALLLDQELKDKVGIAIDLGNLGSVYKNMSKYPEALDFDFKALQLSRELKDKRATAAVIGNIGNVYVSLKNYAEAEKYMKEALALADSVKYIDVQRDVTSGLADLYAKTGRWQQAYQYCIKYFYIKDLLISTEKSEQIGKIEAKAEYDKQFALQQADEGKKTALAKAESKRQKIILLFVGIIALAIAFIAVIIFRTLKITRKQKTLVDEKNKEITDSITYAKRLQDAILPPLNEISRYLPQSFVLYKPKDIVAGDFYWMERAGESILIAAADCTGHGVPGAMVSVICSTALNRAVKEFHIIETGKILDKVRELVLETFEKSEDNVQDGMDISLCCINTNTKVIQWSGAYNSLWYIHNGEIKELRADKQPIGKIDKPLPFNTHNLNLQKGDTLYLFTDGYADQFGGPKGKKFKYKQMEELLLANVSKPMDEQKNILETALNDWKGVLEQVDDILVIGIRI